ncbi:LD-carboxypeptidase [Paludibacterium yongneupense]|uniref:LD-carboxypeptidase n=1 Tax=Paludibacterium yongneupense TaxID=400061 RepID=UPI0009FD8EC0|nr:LD-carboxypeptidase [Paludibacterium yongneupense]
MSTLIGGCAAPTSFPAAAPAAATGPTLRLMALAGPLGDRGRAERGIARLERAGFRIGNRACIQRRFQRFAGSDAERLADLNALAASVAPPDVMLATRGGYGAVRLLDEIDYDRLCPRLIEAGTVLTGYSDITAVQLALFAKGGVVSFSGPMLYGDFARETTSAFTMQWWQRVLTTPEFTVDVNTVQSESAQVEGVLWGGNLSVVAGLAGTPWMPAVDGGILFLEDVGEDVYRIERLLFQLLDAGILARQSAIVLGHFSNMKEDGYDPEGFTLETVLDNLRARLKLPIATGLPIGHVPDIVPLPIGAMARLAMREDGFALTVSGYPTLRCPAPAGMLAALSV